MGYMGFGMRKKDYKRRPKESFKKLKELYGNDVPKSKINPNAPKLSSDEVLKKWRFKSILETRAFQIFKMTIVVGLLGWIVYGEFIQPWLHEKMLEQFKQNLAKIYSKDHNFILSSGNQLSSSLLFFNFDSCTHTFLYAVQGIAFTENPTHYQNQNIVRIGTKNSNAIDININETNLTIIIKDSTQTVKDKWILVFSSDTVNEQYKKILEQLKIKPEYVSSLREKLKSTKLEYVLYGDSITFVEIANSRKYGTYEFVRTNKNFKETKDMIELDVNTYLRRRK